jgi:DNA-binding Lrp family transcriptional regulator
VESDTITPLDRALIHALHLSPRAPFRLLGEVLGTSDQTVARRYRRLGDILGLRVQGQIDPYRVGISVWFMRLQCAPDAAGAIAQALAERPDTAWVRLASVGTEINCTVQGQDDTLGHPPLLDRLTGSRRIVGLSAHAILHAFSSSAWQGLTCVLDAEQVGQLRASHPTLRPPSAEARPLDATDRRLIELLARDGRTPTGQLAGALGWHESTLRRKLVQLIEDGALTFDVDYDERGLGLSANTTLWASVEPAQLETVGRSMAQHPEVPFVAATTGPTNLLASVLTSGNHGLFEYLTQRVSHIPGIRHVETAPVLRTVKRAGLMG